MPQSAEARAGACLDVIEQHLRDNGPFFLGDDPSAVDFYLLMLARWARTLANPPRLRPHIANLLEAIAARPAVRSTYAQQGIRGAIY